MILCYITGTPGTGKTTVANIVSDRIPAAIIEIKDLIIQEGHFWGHDIPRNSLIIDEEGLLDSIKGKFTEEQSYILVGLPMDLTGLKLLSIAVLRCEIPTLRKRLAQRPYSEEKVEENIQSEIMDIVLNQMVSRFPSTPLLEIDTTNRSPDEVATKIGNFINDLG